MSFRPDDSLPFLGLLLGSEMDTVMFYNASVISKLHAFVYPGELD